MSTPRVLKDPASHGALGVSEPALPTLDGLKVDSDSSVKVECSPTEVCINILFLDHHGNNVSHYYTCINRYSTLLFL